MKKFFIPFLMLSFLVAACGDTYENDEEPVQNQVQEEQPAETGQETENAEPLIARVRIIDTELKESAPEELYGGTYFADDIKIVIQLCEDTEENEAMIKSLLAGKVEDKYLEYIRFEECRYSHSFLNDIQQTILAEYDGEILDVGISRRLNRCWVVIKKHDEDFEAEILEQVGAEIPAFSEEEEVVIFWTEDEVPDGV